MNNDQLEIGAPVSRADHRRITAHYRLARKWLSVAIHQTLKQQLRLCELRIVGARPVGEMEALPAELHGMDAGFSAGGVYRL